jgi:hypothetical protein
MKFFYDISKTLYIYKCEQSSKLQLLLKSDSECEYDVCMKNVCMICV